MSSTRISVSFYGIRVQRVVFHGTEEQRESKV